MKKGIKITINILIFLLIGGFAWYMIRTVSKGEPPVEQSEVAEKDNFVSPYKLISSFNIKGTISSFDFYNEHIYLSAKDSVFVFDVSGKALNKFSIDSHNRDMAIADDLIYLLYPTKIEVYRLSGEKLKEWEACSDNSDYCDMALSADYVFVTDVENKNICQYTKDGNFIKFIKSPNGFIIPSYSFDIININDTLYCANSGRHLIESYTINGEYITAFGKSGEEAGAFAGCCNPAYLAKTSRGDILTSEKGNPRISCYDKSGKFRTILLNDVMLGGGTSAYEVKSFDDYLLVAGKDKISVFQFDANAVKHSACASCTADCPLRKGVNQ
jgi:hypothetical protein